MTDSTLLIDESISKTIIMGNFCCNKNYLLLFLINVIVIQSYIYYQQHCKWQEIWESINPMLSDIHDLDGQLYSLIKRQEEIGSLITKRILMLTEKPMIYAITPTFGRPVQKAELTRLSQTFLHVPNFHWIVVEDATRKTDLVTHFLEDSGLIYTHLVASTPMNYKLGRDDPNWKKPRGVEQRNAALHWLRENLNLSDRGVVFFADDDNTYSVKLFREMEKIQKVGVWPVGLVGGLMVEKPLCNNVTNKVVGFNAAWKPNRPFPIDMAGFAINVTLLLQNKEALFSYDVQSGYQESEILRHIVTRDQLEPLADCCSKVYVWHTRTEPPKLNVEQLLIKKGRRSNTNIEV